GNAATGESPAKAAAGTSSVSPSARGKAPRAARMLSPSAREEAAAASALTSVFSAGGQRSSPAPAVSSPGPMLEGVSRAVPATSVALAARLGPPPVSAMPPPLPVSTS
ncbi:unnamed protein product, partial [Laminaria digitata]